MSEFICNACGIYVHTATAMCPNCRRPFVFLGPEKNITDTLLPNCLVHRYQGSDLLEPAQLLKEGKINMKVAFKLRDLTKPVSVPKREVYSLDPALLAAINALRDQRCETMKHYDVLIGAYWARLSPVSCAGSQSSSSLTVTSA